MAGSFNVKEIRAVRDIGVGEELCANYIDSFEVILRRVGTCILGDNLFDEIGYHVIMHRETKEIEKMALYLHL